MISYGSENFIFRVILRLLLLSYKCYMAENIIFIILLYSHYGLSAQFIIYKVYIFLYFFS